VTCEEGSKAYRLELRDGRVDEEPLEARLL
jgi:hypothetical protein